LTAPCWPAKADMREKMVVPTWGRREISCFIVLGKWTFFPF
jgi:hypothetical protein